MDKVKLPTITKEELLFARGGVNDAVWRMITNATQMPCLDFYDTVKEGVAKGIEELGAETLARLVKKHASKGGRARP
jgi:hypothetical protein